MINLILTILHAQLPFQIIYVCIIFYCKIRWGIKGYDKLDMQCGFILSTPVMHFCKIYVLHILIACMNYLKQQL